MGAKVRIIIDIVSLNGKKKVSPAVVVCIISVIQIQKDLRLFRAAPFAFVAVGNVIESTLSDILRHPHPRLPVGRLKSRKNKKSAFGGKKSPAVAGTKTAIKGEPVSSSNEGDDTNKDPASSCNSVGVAFPQPRVAGEDRYPG